MSKLHHRNIHRQGYDFDLLCQSIPELANFVHTGPKQQRTIDFANPVAVKLLNKALLFYHYGIQFWDIPEGYLCPAIPGRADYIHYLADLLGEGSEGKVPTGNKVRILDIGAGANCVYPILGNRIYGWSFVGTEVDTKAAKAAEAIINFNKAITKDIDIRIQRDKSAIFAGIIQPDERFFASMCNPPFHSSLADARSSNRRKVRGLSGKSNPPVQLNFGGQYTELIYPGGELAFILQMISESAQHPKLCQWFTTLVSQEKHLKPLLISLKKVAIQESRIIEMAQGQKQSRLLAWRY